MNQALYGAIIGDVVGSVYEWHNIKQKAFPLFSKHSRFTDDTVMSIAVAKAIVTAGKDIPVFQAELVRQMQGFGRSYPRAGYGGSFAAWLAETHPAPYGSYGNGSAMRVSPCALVSDTLEEAEKLAEASASVTHNHPEGVKGAKAVAAAIWLAGSGAEKAEIRAYIERGYYPLDRTLDEIRPFYTFDVSCQGSVPQAILAFLESTDFEDAIRNAVSIGGDSDTIADMAGAIAWAYYGKNGATAQMRQIWSLAKNRIPEDLLLVAEEICGD